MPTQAPKHPPMAKGKRMSVNLLRGNTDTNPNRNVVKWQGLKMKIIVRVNVLKYICKHNIVKHINPCKYSIKEGLRPLPFFTR